MGGKGINSAAIEKYGISYQQIYSWVRKYEQKGVNGLIDKRGNAKTETPGRSIT